MSESPAPRRSTRAASSSSINDKIEDENQEATNVANDEPAKKVPKTKKPAAKKAPTKAKAKKSPAKRNGEKDDDASVSSQDEDKPKKKRAKAPPHQRITERDPLPKLWDPSKASNGSYSKLLCHFIFIFVWILDLIVVSL